MGLLNVHYGYYIFSEMTNTTLLLYRLVVFKLAILAKGYFWRLSQFH